LQNQGKTLGPKNGFKLVFPEERPLLLVAILYDYPEINP